LFTPTILRLSAAGIISAHLISFMGAQRGTAPHTSQSEQSAIAKAVIHLIFGLCGVVVPDTVKSY